MKSASESSNWLTKTAVLLSCVGILNAPQAVAHDISNISAAQVQAMNQALRDGGYTPLDNPSPEQKKMHEGICTKFKRDPEAVLRPQDCIYVGHKKAFWNKQAGTRAFEFERNDETFIMQIVSQTIKKNIFKLGSVETEKGLIFILGTR